MPIENRIPYTEMFEVVQNELIREAASGEENKYKGQINLTYTNELPSVLPERYLRKEGFITTVAEYTTGTVTVGSGTSNIVGTGTTWTSAHTNYWIKIDGEDPLHRVTYDAATSLDFQNSLTWTGSSGSGKTYTLFQDRYQLASDFDYLCSEDPENPAVVYVYSNGAKIPLYPWTEDAYNRNFNGTTGDPGQYAIKWESATPYIFVFPATSAAEIVGYYYVPVLTSMVEYTAGTITLTTTTAVAGASTLWGALNTANTYYLRNDADGTGSGSKWTKISSIDSSTAITLTSAFSYTSGTGISYTISEITKLPARFDSSILYRAAMVLDPDNLQFNKWAALYQDAIGTDTRVESKRKRGKPLRYFPGARR